ncbi:peptide MFS transporter [Stakelama saccharophila]|uniref:Peptide MFS transporter n=1 Tax=Stakelama saccharophila TaxID=3075605 RepID=A0ABZ0BCY8_9SPHN|nr:peptide MFS transporter [Stakelama sp. W311]WNO55110.1 peptide MFS transporter [Stakelama sp. W311]
MLAGAYAVTRPQKEVFGHPKGLYVLFFAEMWERFSYYGMRALLIFYLTKHWLFDDSKANLIYGAYTSLVYITPVLGGYLADKWLGQRKAVLFGAVVLTGGHFLMAFEGTGGQSDPTINIFWLALSFIIVGSGFLKANISVIVGQLYSITDVRRDSAYTIFYMGINVGAAVGTIIAGWLGENWGWSWGFGAAGVGMLLGLVVFIGFKPLLQGKGEPTDPQVLKKAVAGVNLEWLIYGAGLLSIAVIWALIQAQDVVGSLMLVSGVVLLLYVLATGIFELPYGSFARAPSGPTNAFRGASALIVIGSALYVGTVLGLWAVPESLAGIVALAGFALLLGVILQQGMTKTDHARDRIYVIIFLIALNPIFWGLFEQAGGSLSLFTDRYVDRAGIDASLFQSVNPIYIILLGPLLAMLWPMLGKRGLEPSTPAKFGIGLILLGAGFLVLNYGAHAAGMATATPVIFIFLIYFLHTSGELCLSPVGLSAMNRLAPKHIASLIMAAWFFGTAGGNFVAGLIGQATGGEDGDASKQSILAIYSQIGWVTVGVGVVVMFLAIFVKRLSHLDTLKDEPDHAMEGDNELAEPQAAGFDPKPEELRPSSR